MAQLNFKIRVQDQITSKRDEKARRLPDGVTRRRYADVLSR